MTEMVAAALADLAQGMTAVELDGAKLLLVRDGDAIRAFEGHLPPRQGSAGEGRAVRRPHHLPLAHGRLRRRDRARCWSRWPCASLHRHAVRIAGGDVLVDATPLPAPEPAHPWRTDRLFVLVGTGAASAMAAVTLRD